ncbi:PAS domain S-box protein [Rufibacter glacialis]|uniref:histidine kinase n=1 Tax=Rufibacter glacialis TaxID=1259555 RepID=A0A5M8QHI2_9BACT|nr:PAS domain S-box protein [Rufibacter glacialis]KAA6435489.1 PAS domain S-box protein [Rufibacter glacialis]GGK63981.1 hypothetical protein GCM10011405_09930 [Rufibacter glacialis]
MSTSHPTDLYRNSFEHSPEPTLLIAPDYLVIDANRAARLLYGFTEVELAGKEWLALTEASGLRPEEITKEALAKDSMRLPHIGVKKNGERFHCTLSVAPLEAGTGKGLICTILPHAQQTASSAKGAGVAEDGAPEVSAFSTPPSPGQPPEAQDQLNALKLTRIYDNLTEVIYLYEVIHNTSFRFESVNSAFLRVTGLRKEQVVGRYVEEVIPEPSLTLVRAKYAQAIETGQTVRWEEVTPYPTGVKTGLVSVTPLYDEHQICTSLLGTVTDITDIRAAEKDLKVSNERYEYATKATRDAIYDWNVVTGDFHLGEGFAKLFGFDAPSTADGLHFWDNYLHPEDRAAVHRSLDHFLGNDGQEQWEFDYRFRRADGSYAYVADQAFAVRDTDGKLLRVVGAIQDLTTRKEHEAERELLISHLTQRNTELEQFSFITSHNLRAPISNLIGLAHLLDPEATDQAQTHFIVSKIKESAQQLNSIVEDLSEILVVRGSQQEGAECISLRVAFEGVCQAEQELLTEAGATIEADFSGGDSVYFSPEYLRNIFLNLLTNSVKFRSPARNLVIKLQTETLGGRRQLTFSDNGVGIDLGRYGGRMFLYQRFQAKEGSKGIGLFMVQEQLRAMGGSISVASEVNVGTTFTILFGENPA